MLIAATLGLVMANLVAPRRPRGPDIILVVWDTCRGDRCSTLGYARPTTPRLDELAADGVSFRRCYTPSPWTPPAHASLFTGISPRHHGLRERDGDAIKPGIPTLATTLAKAGYRCLSVVANPQLRAFRSLSAGFETVDLVMDPTSGKGDGAEAVRRAKALLDSVEEEDPPVFLFLNLMECHLPYSAAGGDPDGGIDASDPAAMAAASSLTPADAMGHNLGVRRVDPGVVAALSSVYDGAVNAVDRHTGSLLDHLRARPRFRGACVAIVGDHGENLGENGALGHPAPLSDGVLHVPLVVRWPGHLEGGRTVDQQVRIQDLHPTLLQVAGAPPSERPDYDGVSLLPDPVGNRTLVAEYGPTRPLRGAMRERFRRPTPDMFEDHRDALLVVQEAGPAGRWKYASTVRHHDDGTKSLVEEALFDLASDPEESRNLLRGERDVGILGLASRLRALGPDPMVRSR